MEQAVPESIGMDEGSRQIVILREAAHQLDSSGAEAANEWWENNEKASDDEVRAKFQEVIDNAGRQKVGAENGKPVTGAGRNPEPAGVPSPDAGGAGAGDLESLRTASEERWKNPTADRRSLPRAGSSGTADAESRQSAVADQVMKDTPDSQVIGSDGEPVPSAEAITQTEALLAQANAEAKNAMNAAADCFQRSP